MQSRQMPPPPPRNAVMSYDRWPTRSRGRPRAKEWRPPPATRSCRRTTVGRRRLGRREVPVVRDDLLQRDASDLVDDDALHTLMSRFVHACLDQGADAFENHGVAVLVNADRAVERLDEREHADGALALGDEVERVVVQLVSHIWLCRFMCVCLCIGCFVFVCGFVLLCVHGCVCFMLYFRFIYLFT